MVLAVFAGIVVVGGLLALFSWVTATLPVSPLVACQDVHGCADAAPDEEPEVLPPHDPLLQDLQVTQ